jgi:hypothetical protein
MDKFRIRGGDFIGIIIPGVILLLNIYMIFWRSLNAFLLNVFGSCSFTINENVIVFLIFLILSYVVGVVFRLLSPDFPDKIAIRIRLIATFWKIGIKTLNRDYNNTVGFYYPLRGFYQDFPYFTWFMEYIRKSMPDIYDFYENNYAKYIELPKKKSFKYIGWLLFTLPIIVFVTFKFVSTMRMAICLSTGILILSYSIICLLGFSKTTKRDDYNDPYPDKKTWKDFLNYCKLVVLKKSNILGEEILFAEGLSRMASGSFYAIAYSIIILIFQRISMPVSIYTSFHNFFHQAGPFSILFGINLLLLFIITWGTHHVRVKEAMTVFTAYGIVMTKKFDS